MNRFSRLPRFVIAGLATVLLAAGSRAELLVSSQDTNTIFRFDENTGAYLGVLMDASDGLNGPVGMRLGPDGKLYVGNQTGGNVLQYDFSTDSASVFATAPVAFGPADVQFLPDGDLLVSNFYGNSIIRFDGATGDYDGDFTSGGVLIQPTNMLFSGDDLIISSLGTNEVLKYNAATGEYIDTLISAGSAGLAFPAGLALEGDDTLYVSSLLGQQILQFDLATGAPIGTGLLVDAPPFSFPSDLLQLPDSGGLLIATTGSQGVLKFNGVSLTTFAYAPGLQIAGQMLLVAIPETSSVLLSAAGFIGFIAFEARRRFRRRAA